MWLGTTGTPAFSVSLYNNASNVPGTVDSVLNTTDNLNFTPTGTITLAPSTTYWLTMTSTVPYSASNYAYTFINTSNFSYDSTLPGSNPPVADGWTVPTLMYSSNKTRATLET